MGHVRHDGKRRRFTKIDHLRFLTTGRKRSFVCHAALVKMSSEAAAHNVFRYSISAARSASVNASPKLWPWLPYPRNVVS